jgi:hypothetical protein
MIHDITEKLYADRPQETLYHYTTFTGLMGIIESRVLWASDIRYLNDSAELKHTADLINIEITDRINNGHPNPHLLNQFLNWITHRITNGHMLFASSFRAHGNLLSQWRGYSKPGKGVSIGFSPYYILKCAQAQAFQIGKCVYDPAIQSTLICQILDSIEAQAAAFEQLNTPSRDQSETSYHQIFETMEGDLLRIAAILKHPSFQEEDEWRLVSPAITDFLTSPVLFREGTSMLVPYYEFQLLPDNGKAIAIEHMYLGPTSHMNISMNSLSMYLAKNNVAPKQHISFCQIPYRHH